MQREERDMDDVNAALRERAIHAGLFVADVPDQVPPPGATLQMRLEELGMTQAELAVRTDLTAKHLSQLMNGIVPLTADVAQRLEYATGVPARWWNRLEADHRSAETRLRRRADADAHARWVKRLPVAELVRLGVLPKTPADIGSRLEQLLAFFGVASPEAYESLWARPAAAFRQSAAYEVQPDAVHAWLRLGEISLAALTLREGPLPPLDATALTEALPGLRPLTRVPLARAWPEVRDRLRACGLAVLLVPEVKGARSFGATRWVGGRPLVQLSLRGRTEDGFWFTLLHELGHVLIHGRRHFFVDIGDEDDVAAQVDGVEGDPEQEASSFAVATLLGDDPSVLDEVTSEDDAVAIASTLGIDAGIVVARLRATGAWSQRRGQTLRRRSPSIDALLNPSVVQRRARPAPTARTRPSDA